MQDVSRWVLLNVSRNACLMKIITTPIIPKVVDANFLILNKMLYINIIAFLDSLRNFKVTLLTTIFVKNDVCSCYTHFEEKWYKSKSR